MSDHEPHANGIPPERPRVAGITTLLQALADPVRMEVVRILANAPGPVSCGNFGVGVTKSTLTHHFRVLRDAGVIDGRYVGTRKLISLRREDVDSAYPGLLASLLRAPTEGPAVEIPLEVVESEWARMNSDAVPAGTTEEVKA